MPKSPLNLSLLYRNKSSLQHNNVPSSAGSEHSKNERGKYEKYEKKLIGTAEGEWQFEDRAEVK